MSKGLLYTLEVEQNITEATEGLTFIQPVNKKIMVNEGIQTESAFKDDDDSENDTPIIKETPELEYKIEYLNKKRK